jgi:4-amino-4-deoxy-L-arabinose transferase-like glycosyltransferase
LAGLLFFARLGTVGLFDADEPAYAVAAREMRQTGDWVTPTFNGQPRFDKPILFYYLIVAAYAVFGISEFAARFWSALGGVVLAGLIWALGRRHLPRAAGGAALAFLLNPLTWILGRAAVTDMLLTLSLTACLALAYEALAAKTTAGSRRAWLAAAACSALAVLVKGPIGIVLPGLILGAYTLLTGQVRWALRRPGLLPGAALFLGLTLPWYLLVLRANGWDFVQGFILKHHLRRYTGDVSGHAMPFWFFVPVLLAAFFPWSAFVPAALVRVAAAWRRCGLRSAECGPSTGSGWKMRNERLEGGGGAEVREGHNPQSAIRNLQRGEWERYCAVWFGVTFLFFSGARTKLPSYLFPAFPALGFLVAGWMTGAPASRRALRWSAALLAFLGLAYAAGAASVPWILQLASRQVPALAETPYTGWVHGVLAVLIAAGTVAGAVAAWGARRAAAGGVLATMMVLVGGTLLQGVLPLAHEYVQRPLQSLVEEVRGRLRPGRGDAVIVYGFNAPSVVFYAGQRVLKVERGDREGLRQGLAPEAERRAYALVRTRDAGDLAGLPGVFLVARRGGYSVYSNRVPP